MSLRAVAWLLAGTLASLGVLSVAMARAPQPGANTAASASSPTVAKRPDLPPTLKVGSLTLPLCPHKPAYCGTLDRALDPTGEVPGRIGIHFTLWPRKQLDAPAQGTLVAVEGGPGYPSGGTAYSYLQLMRPLMGQRDLLLVDNRGTGRSAAINCQPLQDARESTVDNIAACGRSLGATAPLYSSAYAADDLAAVLQALGRSGIDLYGDSYGTYFSQVFAYRHPTLLRTVVLDSAYPVPMVGGETAWYPTLSTPMRDKFNHGCARSAVCLRLPGNSIYRISQVLQALREAPFAAKAQDADGRWRRFTAEPSLLALVMFTAAPAVTTHRELDAAARAFLVGDRLPLLRLMAETLSFSESRDSSRSPAYYSAGLFWAVNCQDVAQVYDMTLPPAARALQWQQRLAQQQLDAPDLYAPFSIDEFRRMALDYSLLEGCVAWPSPPASHPPGPLVPPDAVMPDVPVLVLSGEFDDITSPAEGAIVASLFPRGKHLVLANSFHLTALQPLPDNCGPAVVRHFIDSGGEPGDASCAARVPAYRLRPDFVRRLADMPPPNALPGNHVDVAGLQAAAAALHTAGDAAGRAESNGDKRGPGLRGGQVEVLRRGANPQIRLHAVRWVEDLAVDGLFSWPRQKGPASATLDTVLPDGRAAHIEARWTEPGTEALVDLTGSVGGQRLRARMLAP